MAAADYRTQDADIDIGRLFGAVWRNKFVIVISAIVVTALMYFLLSTIEPRYEADSRLLIESSESVFTRPQNSEGRDGDASLLDQQGVTSQVQILTSSDLLMQVADQLKLADRAEFDEAQDISSLKAGLIALGLLSDPSLVAVEKRVLDNVRKRLTVYAVENSRVIVIEFRSADPDLAAKFPNALAEAYLNLEAEAQLATTGKAASYLADEIDELQDSVRVAEEKVAEFRSSSDLLVGQNNSVLATQQLTEISSELSRVRANRAEAESRARTVRAALDGGASLDTIPDIAQSPLIARLRERQIELNSQIADMSTTLLPGHPRVQALQSQLNDLSGRIRDEARKVAIGLENSAEIARSREQELTQELNQLKVASSDASERQVELRALEREADSQRALLESYLVRYREAQSRDEGRYAPAKARLISQAVVPVEPAFPKMVPLLGATFFVALLLMTLATILRELFSGRALVPAGATHTVSTTETVVAENGEPTLAKTEVREEVTVEEPVVARPEPVLRPAVAAPARPKPVVAAPVVEEPEPEEDADAANDNYGVAALAERLVEWECERMIVVSPEGDDAAAASVDLARRLADTGMRTILVDLTGTGAASLRMLHADDCPGITDLLTATASYSEIIYPDLASNAHVIPTGLADPARAMRAVDRLPIILDALVSAYDMVIVECGPTDASGLKRLVGGDAMVVLSVIDPQAPEIVETAGDLVDGGFEDLVIVSAKGAGDTPVSPEPRRAYAR